MSLSWEQEVEPLRIRSHENRFEDFSSAVQHWWTLGK